MAAKVVGSVSFPFAPSLEETTRDGLQLNREHYADFNIQRIGQDHAIIGTIAIHKDRGDNTIQLRMAVTNTPRAHKRTHNVTIGTTWIPRK